jgi:hypothetical protein
MAKSRGIAEQWYDLALYEYGSAMGLEEAMGDQEKIDGHWGLSAKYSWFSLVLGNPNAPYALYKCFGQGLGVKKDEYIASLMFGVAKKLDDPKCQQGMKCRDMRDSAMTKQINDLHKLILDTLRRKIPLIVEDENAEILCQQMDIFRDAIKLPSTYTKDIQELFVSSNQVDPSSQAVHHDDVKVPLSAPSPSPTTIKWQGAGSGVKVTDMISEGITYGQMQEQEITHTFQFKVNNQHVTISKYRSVTMPDSINSGETFEFRLALKQPNGSNIPKSDSAYLVISYNSHGQLEKMLVPNNPAISHTDYWAPALVGYHGKIYTLPVSSGHYYHLTEVLRQNGKRVEIENTDPGLVLNVQPVVPVAVVVPSSIHQVQASGTNYVAISGDVQPSEECCCCILM